MSPPMSTKEIILRESIHLFANDGYEAVSMKTIARASGIKAASIYNHYRSKDEILGNIYSYYQENQNRCRLTEEGYLPILKTGTALEILGIFNYPMFDEGDPEPLMFDIIRIIWSRIYTDPKARVLYREHVVEDAYRYMREVLGKGIELGRININADDIHTFSSVLLATRNFVASSIAVDPDVDKWRENGTSMIHLLGKYLTVN